MKEKTKTDVSMIGAAILTADEKLEILRQKASADIVYFVDKILSDENPVFEEAVKSAQLKRAAKWLKAERKAGRVRTLGDAVNEFRAALESEICKHGYSVSSFNTALYSRRKDLGIADFIKPRKNGG